VPARITGTGPLSAVGRRCCLCSNSAATRATDTTPPIVAKEKLRRLLGTGAGRAEQALVVAAAPAYASRQTQPCARTDLARCSPKARLLARRLRPVICIGTRADLHDSDPAAGPTAGRRARRRKRAGGLELVRTRRVLRREAVL
jgi:hypothetical protein